MALVLRDDLFVLLGPRRGHFPCFCARGSFQTSGESVCQQAGILPRHPVPVEPRGEGGRDPGSSVLSSKRVPKARGALVLHGSASPVNTRRGRGPASPLHPRILNSANGATAAAAAKRLHNFLPVGPTKARQPEPNLQPSLGDFRECLPVWESLPPRACPLLVPPPPNYSQHAPRQTERKADCSTRQETRAGSRGVPIKFGAHTRGTRGGCYQMGETISNSFYLQLNAHIN